MTSLPYAPRPILEEGLPSWVARLAVHNFMKPAAFCNWLGIRDITDVSQGDMTHLLAAKTGLSPEAVGAVMAASGGLPRHWQGATDERGLRGAACPACCREAAEAGHDHWWLAKSEALLRVSCERHQCHLVALSQLIPTRMPQGFRLLLLTGQLLGSERRYAQPIQPVLEIEKTLANCLAGRRPSRAWRLTSAAEMTRAVDLLANYVLCAPIGELPFADRFDTVGTGGSGVFSVDPRASWRGVGFLEGQPVRMRCNVMAALHTLLARPERLCGEVDDVQEWRTAADENGPYRALAQHLGHDGRERLAADLPKLSAAISRPAFSALTAAAYELG